MYAFTGRNVKSLTVGGGIFLITIVINQIVLTSHHFIFQIIWFAFWFHSFNYYSNAIWCRI